jgi:hypothetical protein
VPRWGKHEQSYVIYEIQNIISDYTPGSHIPMTHGIFRASDMIQPGRKNGKRTSNRHWNLFPNERDERQQLGLPLFDDALALKIRFEKWTRGEVNPDGTPSVLPGRF